MAVRPVVRLPDPVLTTPSAAVGRIDDAARRLAADLFDTMRASPACVGLAAPQIGVGLRAFVLDVTGHPKAVSCHGVVVMFDPVVLDAGEPVTAREGCMSVPDLTGDVARAGRMAVEGTGLDGERSVVEADAFEARAFQHEIDHLDGLVFLDRVSGPGAVHRRKVYK
ncbi:MAG TPA: peptide deformylase [Acidimicrobiales bacterium]|nr:peptide deformylase [Acidimicrobiales bacterium]